MSSLLVPGSSEGENESVVGNGSAAGRRTPADPTKVVCSGPGLRWGYVNLPIRAEIDTRRAGPGELIVYCEGPKNNAQCLLEDHTDGTMTLSMTAVDVGYHRLYVKYDDADVTGSPFIIRVSPASLVKIRGPGLRNGILNSFIGEFRINSERAGPGDLKIRIGGPKGAFKVMTQKEGKTLTCRYNPKEPGHYMVNVLWSDDHLPGSPYRVYVASSQDDLQYYLDSGLPESNA